MTQKVKPVPEGFHTVTPHLMVRGAAKAIDFYKKAFGAQEVMRMAMPDGQTLMHAEIKIGDSIIFLGDEFPGMGCRSPQTLGGTPMTINLYVDNADAVFDRAVAAGAKVTMPLSNMFWGDRYGKLQDPFGFEWSVAAHIEDVPPGEMHKRAQAAIAQMGAGKN
jgi:PhnB protein